MKDYTIQASIGQQTTTIPIKARNTFSAKVLAVQKINASHVSDKRWARGEIVLKDSEGKPLWKIPAEEETKKE